MLGGDLYFLLTMAGHGLAAQERTQHNRDVPRYLNAAGRWANTGRKVPLLVWICRDDALMAAGVASAQRKRPVTVAMASSQSWQLGRQICLYAEAHERALMGYVEDST